jgi:hypothetical protein
MPAVGLEYLLPGYVDLPGAWQDAILIPAPPAGVNWSRIIPADTFEIPMSVRFVFSASATVASRTVRLIAVDQDGTAVAEVSPPAAVTAGQGWTFNYSPMFSNSTAPILGIAQLSLFPIALLPGWRLATSVDSLQAGDTFLGIVVVSRRYATGDRYARQSSASVVTPLTAGMIDAAIDASASELTPAVTSGPEFSSAPVAAAPPPLQPASTTAPAPASGPVLQPHGTLDTSGGGTLVHPAGTGGTAEKPPPPPPPDVITQPDTTRTGPGGPA